MAEGDRIVEAEQISGDTQDAALRPQRLDDFVAVSYTHLTLPTTPYV